MKTQKTLISVLAILVVVFVTYFAVENVNRCDLKQTVKTTQAATISKNKSNQVLFIGCNGIY